MKHSQINCGKGIKIKDNYLLKTHKRNLRKFLSSLAHSEAELDISWPFMCVAIPDEFLDDDDKGSLTKSLTLTGDECISFHQILEEFRKDKAFEYLKDRELKDRLFYLVCEVHYNKKNFRNTKNLKSKIEQFLENILSN